MPVVTRALLGALVAAPVVAVVACSGSVRDDGFEDGTDGGAGNGAITDRPDDGTSGGITGGDSGPGAGPIQPGEIDLAAVTPCDADLDVDGDVDDFLKAIGLCKSVDPDVANDWGVLEAKFTKKLGADTSNNNAGQHGILPKFGSALAAREGERLGVLSTGYAREFNTLGSQQKAFRESQPWDGEDAEEAQNDVIVLRLKIRVPTNAKSFSFDFNFYSSEWPNFIGSDYNDEFRANLDGQNISFGANQQPVSVNLGFFDRCKDGARIGCELNFYSSGTGAASCPGGADELANTGFGIVGIGCKGEQVPGGGATGWLTTKSPVEPGSTIELEFAIWDTADTALDSSVLLDNFKWDADPVTTGTDRPVN
ncbi:MAG: hypothetical protein EOO74_07990 [Myxococcales bacterium]|nr:MAG: hypothetical protein EOO74_07990 [Myxococcales bacterium]